MDKCFICEKSGGVIRLFNAIGSEGVIRVCEDCAFDEHIPLIRKPTTFQLKESEKKEESFQERVSRFDKEREIKRAEEVKRAIVKKQDVTLKDIVERNVKLRTPKLRKPRLNLIDNFHWIIFRARRNKHLTQAQLAREISESETAIKMVEGGNLPEDEFRLINKLENFLNIRLTQDGKPVQEIIKKEIIKNPVRILNFKADTLNNLTISDLQEMKRRKERAILGNLQMEKGEKKKEVELREEKQKSKKEDLSNEEIDDLIFGK